MGNAELASALRDRLQLSYPPVAVAFVNQQPSGVHRTEKLAPSACGFWRQAENEVFYATMEDHFNCPVGAYVMGFPLPEKQMQELMSEIGFMCTNSYVQEAEVPQVPKVSEAHAGIVYGPLAQFPGEPDAVLLWLTPQQAMVMNETCGLIDWTQPAPTVYGRPGCAAIPLAMQSGQSSLSFGCVGTRVNTDIPGEYLLMAVPKSRLGSLEQSLFVTSEVHQQMRTYYLQRAAKVPSVRS